MQVRTKMILLVFAVLLLAASPVFAQSSSSGVSSGELKYLGGAVGMAIASGLCGLGQGKAVAGAVEAMARNPGAAGRIQTALILGLAFVESLAIFTLLIVFATR